MNYEPFSIVAVPFPFTDKEQTKRRPALVLSAIAHQEQTQHVTLAMITSAKNSNWASDYTITLLKDTGLSAPSIMVYCAQRPESALCSRIMPFSCLPYLLLFYSMTFRQHNSMPL